MNLLFAAVAVVALLLYWQQRRVLRAKGKKVEAILNALNAGERPSSFIFHGDPVWQRVGLGLEQLGLHKERLEKQISVEEFNLQTLLASVEEGIIIVDTEQRVRLANAAFQRLLGVKRNPVGSTVLEVLRHAEIEETVRAALESGVPESREVTVAARNLAFSVSPVRERGGSLLGVAVLFRDITRLTQLEQVRREFVSNVSHEFRTPLSIFQGYLEMLLDNPALPEEELVAALQTLQRHSGRLNLLVEDLLMLARLESRREMLTLAPVKVEALLSVLVADWKLKFAAKKVAFRLEMPGEPLPVVMGDRLRLEQVMNNLLENALNYTPEEGTVTIHAALIPPTSSGSSKRTHPSAFGEVEIRVHDTGSGIPAEDLPHIFERFYRADKARKRERGGTGLGLSIVKHLIQAHGGRVHAESLQGRGTTLSLRLPVAPPLA